MKNAILAFSAAGLCLLLATFSSLLRLNGLALQWTALGVLLFVAVLALGVFKKDEQ